MAEPVRATASVPTTTPERYARQLAAHLGRRCEIRGEGAGVRIVLTDTGDSLLVAREGSLELTATAPEPDGLDRVTSVVGSHLERFGQRNEVRVSWRHS